MRHQPPLWLVQRRTWTLNSELIAFAPAPTDWPWFGQLTLHEQFLCDVTLIHKRWAAVSNACLRRWGQVAISSSESDETKVSNSKQQLDASAMTVRFGLVRQGHRQPPATLQSRVEQIQESGPVSWLRLVPNECDQASVVDDRCLRSQTIPACLDKSDMSETGSTSSATPINSFDHRWTSDQQIINQRTNNRSKLTELACFVVFTDLSEERTLYMAASVMDSDQCKQSNLSRNNATVSNKRPTLKHLQSNPRLMPGLCVKTMLQHKQPSSHRRPDAAQELNQRLAQQPGSPLYCFKDDLGWTLIGQMRKPLEAKAKQAHAIELVYEFDRVPNFAVKQLV